MFVVTAWLRAQGLEVDLIDHFQRMPELLAFSPRSLVPRPEQLRFFATCYLPLATAVTAHASRIPVHQHSGRSNKTIKNKT